MHSVSELVQYIDLHIELFCIDILDVGCILERFQRGILRLRAEPLVDYISSGM